MGHTVRQGIARLIRVERIYIIAGEASGDLHGAALVQAIRQRSPGISLRGWGGDLMAGAGCTVVKHYKDLAFMGFVEVVRNLGAIRKNFAFARQDISAFRPDTVVFIDYPGFNMRLLPWVRRKGIRTVYYIAPQVWAWHQSRVNALRRFVDELLVILPFETAFFEKHGVKAHFVGHPLAHRIANFQPDPGFGQELGQEVAGPVVALLPGSRRQEVRAMLPVMMEAAAQHPGWRWMIARAPSLPRSLYLDMIPANGNVTLVEGKTYDLLARARAAVVTSGTATLETALFGVPQVVVYKGNPVSYAIARRIVHVAYISLVNLILDRPLVTELIQRDMNASALKAEVDRLMVEENREKIQAGYRVLKAVLGEKDASAEAAARILQMPLPEIQTSGGQLS